MAAEAIFKDDLNWKLEVKSVELYMKVRFLSGKKRNRKLLWQRYISQALTIMQARDRFPDWPL